MNDDLINKKKIEDVDQPDDNQIQKVLEVSDFDIEVEELLGILEEEENNNLYNN